MPSTQGVARLGASMLAGLLSLATVRGLAAQTIDPGLYVADGRVNAVLIHDGKLYVGGDFSSLGPSTGCLVPFDPVLGARLTGPKVAGEVDVVVPDGMGGWYIGGQFTAIGGVPRDNLAQLSSSFAVSSWNPRANGRVRAIARSGTTVYLGGEFTQVSGQSRNKVAAIDAATGAVLAWNPDAGADPWSLVSALAIRGSTVYIAGRFSLVGGQFRAMLAAVEAVSGLATPWNPLPEDEVWSMVVSGSTVYVGGPFMRVSSAWRLFAAALDASSAAVGTWNIAGHTAPVMAMATDGTRIFTGGAFGVRALDAAGNVLWSSTAVDTVFALSVGPQGVGIAGAIPSEAGHRRGRVAWLDPVTGAVTGWSHQTNGPIGALSAAGATVWIGGRFTSVDPEPRRRLAALDLASGAATSWAPDVDGEVLALAAHGSRVYAAGHFAQIDGQSRNRLAAFDSQTDVLTSWASQPNDVVNALACDAGRVYVGGAFTQIAGQSRSRIAALDPTSGALTGWDPVANDTVSCLALNGLDVIAGGCFTIIGSQFRNRLAALDATTGLARPWNPWVNGPVLALAFEGPTVYVGGCFTSVAGQLRNRLAAVDLASGLATAWNPDLDGRVRAIAAESGRIHVGGEFTRVQGQPRPFLAQLDPIDGHPMIWNAMPNREVLALGLSGAKLYAAGSFTEIGDAPSSFVAGMEGTPAVSVPEPRPEELGLALRLAPNPARGAVRVEFSLPRADHVGVAVLDVQGREVARLIDGFLPSGRSSAVWNRVGAAGAARSGLYFVRLSAGKLQRTERVVLID